MSEVPKLESFNKKTGPPEMINFFLYWYEKVSFQAHRRVPTPHDRCPRTMKRNYFAMKTNGIRWRS